MRKQKSLLKINKNLQTRIVGEIITKSRPSSPYNLLLISSAILTACGLLMDNIPIVIGGMLVAPLLSPILSLGLGASVGESPLIVRSLKIALRSLLIVVVIAIIFGFIFQADLGSNEILRTITNGGAKIPILYIMVAIVAGAIGTFAWVDEDTASATPGVAVAVSLIPPLSAVGIGIGIFSAELFREALIIFFLNFLGIFFGSMTSFSLMNFYRCKEEARERVEKEAKENS